MSKAPLPRSAAVALLLASACTTAAPPPACPSDDAKITPPHAAAKDTPSTPFRVLPEEASPVTFGRMSVFPEPGWNVPRAVTFVPDKTSIVYLAGENNSQEMALFAFD